MSSRTVRSSLAAAVLVLLTVGTATAAPKVAPGEEWYPPPLTCFDVTAGEGTLSHSQEPVDDLAANLPARASDVLADTVEFTITLKAPSCEDGTYRIDVTDDLLGTLATVTIPGDGSTQLSLTASMPPDADGCVKVQVATFDRKGDVVDVAPDGGNGGEVGSGCSGAGGSVWR